MRWMEAVRLHRYGGPEVLTLERLPVPTPGPRDLLVQVKAAGVNPGEGKIRAGLFREYRTPPFTLGYECSGVVREVGPQVTEFQPGDEVLVKPETFRNGAYAQILCVEAEFAAKKPPSLSFELAAAIPMAGLTAFQALELMALPSGSLLFVHGASGSVGSLAVQLAKLRGARVWASASEARRDYVQRLGADEWVESHYVDSVPALGFFDFIFDTLGGTDQSHLWRFLKPGGLLISSVHPPVSPTPQARGGMVQVSPNAQQLSQLGEWLAQGRLTVTIAKTFPLSEARQAHELLESRGRPIGKILLIPNAFSL